jgi:hypothetical protein
MSMHIVVAALVALAAAARPAAAATASELLGCQKAIASGARGVANAELAGLFKCSDKIVRCKLTQEVDGIDPTACLASASAACAKVPPSIVAKETKAVQKAGAVCGVVALAELEQYVAGLGYFQVAADCGAASAGDLATCVLAASRCTAQRQVFRIDPRAQDSLTTAGVAASFPCVAP